MKEQSHKDEMSAALRGDFDRLRERGVAVALAPAEREPEPEPGPPEEVVVPPTADRRGWRDRLLGR